MISNTGFDHKISPGPSFLKRGNISSLFGKGMKGDFPDVRYELQDFEEEKWTCLMTRRRRSNL
jgi:hypothetical protein